MRNHKVGLLLGAGLFCVCLTGHAFCAGASSSRECIGDFVLHREIPVSLAAGTSEHPRLVEIAWVRIEPIYGNSWALTARVGWSAVADATWRIRVELLDDKGRLLRHSRDETATFTGKANSSNRRAMHHAELTLDTMLWEGRRHVARVRVILESAESQIPEPPSDEAARHQLVVSAVDAKSRKPIPDAAVVAEAVHWGEQRQSHSFLCTTDAQGDCRLTFAKADLAMASVTVQKDGYAVLRETWASPSSWPVAHVPLVELPERHVMEMVPAQAMGGIVQDHAGRPIAGAEVRVNVHLEEVGGTASVSRSVRADEKGCWRLEGIPGEADAIYLGFSHPGYVGDEWARRRMTGEELRMLRDLKHVATMTRGLTVSGRVLDEQGEPVPRAAVILAPAYRGGFRHGPICALTDASGRFRFGCARNDLTDTTDGGGSTGVLVEVPGYAAALQRVVVEPNLAPLEFRLKQGRALTARVVDEKNRPLAGAWAVVYPLLEDPRYGRWLENTDEQGQFRIPNAPDHDMSLTVGKSGYLTVRNHPVPASEEQIVVAMKPSPRLGGTVVDADTGKPIPSFDVVLTSTYSGRPRTGGPSRFKQGAFEFTFDETLPESMQLKILAVGYAPLTSEPVSPEGTRVMEFKLARDASFDARALQRELGGAGTVEPRVIRGTVVDPNGQPAPDVVVVVVGVPFSEAVTDAEGGFKLRCLMGGMGLLADRDVPYVVARDRQRNLAVAMEFDRTATEDLVIKLDPGVILAGKVTDADGKGIPGTEISLTFWTTQIGHGMREEATKPDPNGYYQVRAVPSGRRYSVNATAEGYGQEYVQVHTGEAVSNRMELEPMVLKPADLDISGTVVDAEGNPVAGARVYCYGRGQPHRQIQADGQGRFTARGLCAGVVQIQANTEGEIRLHGRVEAEGGATDVKIVVSPIGASGRYVPAKPPLLVGKPLPSFADLGVEQSAAAYKDHMILLCFFDMNQRPSRHCLTALAKRADELKHRGVALLGVQAAEVDAGSLAQWLAGQGVAFSVGSMRGDAKKTTFAWGVQSLPWLILTDRGHTVRAEGFALNELDAQVKNATGGD